MLSQNHHPQPTPLTPIPQLRAILPTSPSPPIILSYFIANPTPLLYTSRMARRYIKRDPAPTSHPTFIPVGWAVRLISIPTLSATFDVSIPTMLKLLHTLEVPILILPTNPNTTTPLTPDDLKLLPTYPPPYLPDPHIAFINLPALEAALYTLLRPTSANPRTHKPRPTDVGPHRYKLQDLPFGPEMKTIAAYYYHWTRETVIDRLRTFSAYIRPRRRPGMPVYTRRRRHRSPPPESPTPRAVEPPRKSTTKSPEEALQEFVEESPI